VAALGPDQGVQDRLMALIDRPSVIHFGIASIALAFQQSWDCLKWA